MFLSGHAYRVNYEFNGLPLHILIVHVLVLGIPLSALLTVLSAVWPAARRRIGIVGPIVALLVLITVPIAQNAGAWLMARVGETPLVQEHAGLGDTMLWFAIGLFVASLVAWGVPFLMARQQRTVPTWLTAVVAVVAIGLSAAAVVQVVRTGESGSRAVFTGNFCAEPLAADGSCPATS